MFIFYIHFMLRKTFCALPVDAGRRLIWITLCKRSAARGMDGPLLLELRSSSTRSGVEERDSLYPELRLWLARGYPPWTPSGVNL
jgi:hypothetical protein